MTDSQSKIIKRPPNKKLAECSCGAFEPTPFVANRMSEKTYDQIQKDWKDFKSVSGKKFDKVFNRMFVAYGFIFSVIIILSHDYTKSILGFMLNTFFVGAVLTLIFSYFFKRQRTNQEENMEILQGKFSKHVSDLHIVHIIKYQLSKL